MSRTHASFFSGVGGLDMGLERAGWTTVSFSEIDPYACAVLVQRILGPSSGATTRGYMHVVERLGTDAAGRMDRAIGERLATTMATSDG